MPPPIYGEVIELFAGSAGYSTFYGCEEVLLVDKDPIITAVWEYLILEATPDGIMSLPDLPNVGDTVDDCDIPQAAKWLIGFWLNRGSATPKRTRTAYSARTDRAQLNWSPRAKERIAAQLPALEGWSILCDSYETVSPRPATWIIDPPYQDKGRHYRVSSVDYADLADFARYLPGQVIVSEGSDADWLPFVSLGDFKTSAGKSRELIWTETHA